jgi:IS5 family transposase
MTGAHTGGEPVRGRLGKAILAQNTANLRAYTRALYRAGASDAVNLVSSHEEVTYADEGYPNRRHQDFFVEKGIKGVIMYEAARGKPLKDWQIWIDKAVEPVRAGVERIFARMKVRHGFTRARYFRLKRNARGFFLLCTAMNIARIASLKAA